jgi:hypothetical protein
MPGGGASAIQGRCGRTRGSFAPAACAPSSLRGAQRRSNPGLPVTLDCLAPLAMTPRRVCRNPPRTYRPIRLSNSQRSAVPLRGGGCPLSFFCSSPKNEGSRAPAGAGAERRTRWPASRSSRSPGRRRSPAGYAHRRAFRRSAAAFSLRRRAALSAALLAPPSASSWQEALVPPGGAPTPPERVLCVQHVRGRRPSPRPGIAGRRLPEDGTESPAPLIRPAPPPRRLSSGAPRRAR